jgi:hypothetical protein
LKGDAVASMSVQEREAKKAGTWQIGVQVDLRRLHVLMTEPESDDRGIDAGVQQEDRH